MRDSRRIQERHDVRLDRVQVIWLTLGAVVALGLMFALGFVVGRRAATFDPPPVASDPIAQVDAAGDLHEELTFYDKLTEPAPAKAKRAPPAAPPQPAPQPPPEPEPSTPTPAAEPSAPSDDPSPPAAEPSSPSDDPVRTALAAGPARPGEYTIQVSAYQSMAEARAYAASLERKGFKPFIVTGKIHGKGTWYRVRLGRFSSESEANQGKQLLAQADIPAWVLKTE